MKQLIKDLLTDLKYHLKRIWRRTKVWVISLLEDEQTTKVTEIDTEERNKRLLIVDYFDWLTKEISKRGYYIILDTGRGGESIEKNLIMGFSNRLNVMSGKIRIIHKTLFFEQEFFKRLNHDNFFNYFGENDYLKNILVRKSVRDRYYIEQSFFENLNDFFIKLVRQYYSTIRGELLQNKEEEEKEFLPLQYRAELNVGSFEKSFKIHSTGLIPTFINPFSVWDSNNVKSDRFADLADI